MSQLIRRTKTTTPVNNLSARFVFAALILLGSTLLISVTAVQSLSYIQSKLHKESDKHIGTLASNSATSRQVFSLSTRIQALEHSYLHDTKKLVAESVAADDELQRIKSMRLSPELVPLLDQFATDLQRFMGNSLTLNLILSEQTDVDVGLEHAILQLDSSIARRLETAGSTGDRWEEGRRWLSVLGEIRESHLWIRSYTARLQNRLYSEDVENNVSRVDWHLDVIEREIVNSNELADISTSALQRIQKQTQRYKSVLKKLRISLTARWRVFNQLVESQENLSEIVKRSEDDVRSGAITLQEQVNIVIANLRLLILLVTVTVAGAGVYLIIRFVRKHIRQPMSHIIHGIERFEAGIDQRAVALNRHDEWDTIEKAFNKMTQRLNDSYQQVQAEQEKFDFLAHHDPLTGLANRMLIYRKLNNILDNARLNNRTFSLMYMDLDQFKRINDSLGHSIGDALLIEVAQRIENELGNDGVAARLGGDEFFIVLPDVSTTEGVAEIAGRINSALAERYLLDGQDIYITNSIGICFFPQDGDDVETLVRNSDTALYQAKRSGRDCSKFYSNEMTSHAHQLINQNSGIRRALEGDQFRLLYQPKIQLADGRITGAEALLRWEHPGIGLLTPDKFLPIAEETGLISEIDDWVFRTVCEQLVSWKKQGLPLANLTFSCNCSGRQFLRDDLLETLQLSLDKTGVDASMLELEITERDIVADLKTCADTMSKLREIGLELAIDDFGTGYSSLNYLKHLPATTLKIDRSFINGVCSDRTDLAIVQSIISLADTMGLHIVAEGIEDETQANLLIELGCHCGQGYYYAKPLTADQIGKLLRDSSMTLKLA